MLDFNRFKACLMEFLQTHGLTYADLKASHKKTGFSIWHINWKSDLNDDFKEDLDLLKNAIDLYDRALSEKDVLAAKAGLMSASIRTLDLSTSSFWSISHDLTKILNNKNFNWPSIGRSYAIPKEYLDKGISEIDQKELVDLNRIQKILIDLVRSHGVTDEELKRVNKRAKRLIWGIDLNSDFNKIFYEKLLALQIAFDGYEKASIQNDRRAARAILQRIRLINFQLYHFLSAIRIALVRVSVGERFWPSFPENYKIPAHYNYK
ncbi:hypothetical protein KMZ15_03740 [Mycoavidus sp. HKI]|uniref:hypothetical protein n=1 Tax=Mycoavidus sp. HKI TaxID=2840467 RepID=UPI001CBC096B|nr:hypothetical protein [Mycoavidus sp. HKI]UAW64782.1 hypothetical protein KMZ15_03740 [Mycoavidus sp. HKI]